MQIPAMLQYIFEFLHIRIRAWDFIFMSGLLYMLITQDNLNFKITVFCSTIMNHPFSCMTNYLVKKHDVNF
jgi:hypothetical protein